MEQFRGLEIPATLAEACSPERTALIVYDMQVGILRQIKGGDQLVAGVRKVLDAARAAGLRVFFMRHLSLPRELMGVFQLRMAMAWQRVATPAEVHPWFLRDSPGFQLTPALTPLSSEAVFDKLTMSAFEGTPLDIALRDCGINSIILVGVAMEIGIEPTVRHAADLCYLPIVVADACGAGHAEAAARSLESIKFIGDAIVTDIQTIVATLTKATKAKSGNAEAAEKNKRTQGKPETRKRTR